MIKNNQEKPPCIMEQYFKTKETLERVKEALASGDYHVSVVEFLAYKNDLEQKLESLKHAFFRKKTEEEANKMSEKKYKLVESLDGKTLEEWAQKLEDNKDFQAIIDDKDVSYAEIAEVMIKALLGGGINDKTQS